MAIPSKATIFRHWATWYERARRGAWGEPSCWACGWYGGTRYDAKGGTAADIDAAWNAVPLQRCHIVPRSLGGSDVADNLFLMCAECHDRAPNTQSREAFLSWACRQSWHARRAAVMAEEFRGAGLDPTDPAVLGVFEDAAFKAWMADANRVGLHNPQAGSTARITASSIAVLVAEWLAMRAAERLPAAVLDRNV